MEIAILVISFLILLGIGVPIAWSIGISSIIIAAMMFGAIAGSAVAAASAIGSALGKPMEDEGYSKEFSAAVNITSSTTGLTIPPSNVLIVYSLASGGASIAALFLAGYIPGIFYGNRSFSSCSFILFCLSIFI